METIKAPVSLLLFEKSQTNSGLQHNATNQLKNTWKRSIRDIGGYWMGYASWEGPERELLDIFQNGFQWEIREMAGGMMTWQGFLAEMQLTYKGQRYRRAWGELANRVKVVYSKIGHNLITNPSCESAVWDAYNTPSTRERSTAWTTHGSYSAHVVANSAEDGVVIDSSISITAGVPYQAHVTVKIVSGEWRLEIYDSAGNIVDGRDQIETGQSVMYANVSDGDNVTTVGLRLFCLDASGEIYADAAVFQLAPTRAETTWHEDTQSQAEYGIIERILSQAGMTDAAAEALALRTLYDSRWAKVLPPTDIAPAASEGAETRLDLIFLGYVFTLANKYTQLSGEAGASTLVTSLVGEAEFVESGRVQTNTLTYNVENWDAYRAWDLLRSIAEAGDASGNRWICQVLADRRLYYEQASSDYAARLRGGKLMDAMGGPLSGWLAAPGLVALDDMPTAYDFGSGGGEDRARSVWMTEVEWSLGEYLAGRQDVIYRSY